MCGTNDVLAEVDDVDFLEEDEVCDLRRYSFVVSDAWFELTEEKFSANTMKKLHFSTNGEINETK